MDAARSILHLDMDAFFASVEQRDNASLRGRPVLVGGDGPRGVVAAASYEARAYGCHSAQPMSIAKRLCPQAIVVTHRGGRYGEVSRQVFAMLDDVSPLVEPISVDEAFVDVTGSERLLGEAVAIARGLRRRIAEELSLTASVGVAPNKFLAKLASDCDKPDGLTVVPRDGVQGFLDPLAIERMWGVGKVTSEKLRRKGIATFADLRRQSREWLRATFGNEAERYWRLSRGIDDRPVTPDSKAKSISHECTFGANLTNADDVRRVLMDQVEQVARRLRKHGRRAGGVSLKIRYGQFETITRSAALPQPTDATAELWEAARAVFDQWAAASFRPVRLIGMAAERFEDGAEQLGLFDDAEHERRRQVDATTDAIVARFGKRAIRRGGGM